MRIAFAADDENETMRAVVAYLSQGHSVLEVATATDWPSIGEAVGQAVSIGDADVGVVMCWTGTGTAIAANKVRGVRAALAWEPWIARGARLWNDANVLALSLKRLAPDAITLDVMMPGMDGWAVLSALKADPQLADIPVVMLTIVDDQNMGYALGAADYLTKPVNPQQVEEVLAAFLKAPAPVTSLAAGGYPRP